MGHPPPYRWLRGGAAILQLKVFMVNDFDSAELGEPVRYGGLEKF
jgi:hypothetical protein